MYVSVYVAEGRTVRVLAALGYKKYVILHVLGAMYFTECADSVGFVKPVLLPRTSHGLDRHLTSTFGTTSDFPPFFLGC